MNNIRPPDDVRGQPIELHCENPRCCVRAIFVRVIRGAAVHTVLPRQRQAICPLCGGIASMVWRLDDDVAVA